MLQSFNSATSDPSNSIDGLSMAAFASGLLAVSVNRPDIASVIELIEFGAPVPEIWQLVAPGRVSPFCLDEPFRIAALFGEIGDKSLPPSSISQVVPVSAGCLYEFSYWGIANADGAAGEILWRTADCSSPSKDVLPVQASRPSFGNASRQGNFASLLKFHRLRAKSPDGAIAAEIRFRTTFDMWALIDRVSFGTVDPTLANSDFLESEAGVPKGWTLVPSSAPGFTFSSVNQTATLFNNGIETVAFTQTVNVKPGASANVEFAGSAQASENFPFLEVAWRDSDVPSVAIVIAPGSPRQRSAVIDVPDDVTEAEFAIQLPAGSQVVVERLRVLSGARLGIPIRVFAEAPGELTVSNINVVTDTRPSHPPPAPETGLCAPTPPGKDPSGEDCDYCPGCAGEHGTRHAEIVLTPARRTAVQARCVNCGTATVRPARRAVASASPARMSAVKPLAILRKPVSAVAVRSLVAPSAAVVGTGTPVVASGAVALKAILGLRIGERTSLENAGIRSVQDLASASPERVAKALQGGSSPSRPAQLISRARGLLIEQ